MRAPLDHLRFVQSLHLRDKGLPIFRKVIESGDTSFHCGNSKAKRDVATAPAVATSIPSFGSTRRVGWGQARRSLLSVNSVR